MTDEPKRYPVIEIFGPTLQGEGALAGRVTHFVRMGGCDYRCAWCDSGYAVLPAEVRDHAFKFSTEEIAQRVAALEGVPEWVTISGGNPALHNLGQLVGELHSIKFKVAVETQGTLWKDWLADVDQLTVSPKPPSAGYGKIGEVALFGFLDKWMTTLPSIVNRPRGDICLKIPVFDEADYEWAVAQHIALPDFPFYFSVVTLMGGLDGSYQGGRIDTRTGILDRYKWLAERISRDPRVGDTTALPQLHALLWGHGRGF